MSKVTEKYFWVSV